MNLKKVSSTQKIAKSNIGSKIQELMNLHNVSLGKIAAATGLTAETIRQIVNGAIKNPGIETLSKIADAFSVSLFQLLETRDITSHVNKKKIKIIDIFDLQKLTPKNRIGDLIDQSIETTEVLYIDNDCFDSEFFAIAVNTNLADKLTNCGMPILKKGDLLIFITNGDYSNNSIILAKHNDNILTLGIVLEIEENSIWVKSVDIPQKQIVTRVKKENLLGVVHNVQFSK